jgi:anaerobic magnesium-protoporphyrin IX monomethyl ester cyclase
MRFLLINPYYPISETPSPPLGLAFLAAALEQAGVEVKILDLVVHPYSREMLKDELNDFSPDLVGMTSVTMSFDNGIEVLKDVKGLDPDILTVMGGPHVTFCAKDTLEAFPSLDLVALGEGEGTIVDLAREACRGRNWSSIEGIAYRNGTEIRNTGMRPPIANLDDLPIPARRLLPLGRYRALGMPISMTTSRGCPFQCIFCVGRKMVGAKVRYRNPAKVVHELETLNRLNFHQINIADDLFTAKEKHCIDVCNEITRRGLKVKWTSFARVDTVTRKSLGLMKEAGCQAVSFGVESGNPEILKTIRKGITREQVIAAVEMCNDAGITPHASFILGLPGETPETLRQTVEFGEELKDMGVSHGFHLLAPFPGTEIREKSNEYGIQILTNDWSRYHANRAIVETSSVSSKMLDDIVIEWEQEFDGYLSYIKRQIERGEATQDETWQLRNLESAVLIYDLMMGRIIEDKGTWDTKDRSFSYEDAMRTLVQRIAGSVKYTQEQIYNTLNVAVDKGNLRYVKDDGKIRWEWVDYL